MSINDLMDDIEQDVKVMMIDGKLKTIREILDSILTDSENERYFSEG